MGTTFVSIQKNGFWMHDSVLELFLRLAALHIEDTVENDSTAHKIRNEWLLASRGYFNGAVALSLDENIETEEGRLVVHAAIDSLKKALEAAPELLDRAAINLMGFSGAYVIDIKTATLIEVADSFLALLDGQNFGTASSAPMVPVRK